MAKIPQATSRISTPTGRSARVIGRNVINTEGGVGAALSGAANEVGLYAERKLKIEQQKEDFKTRSEYEKYKLAVRADYEEEKQSIASDGTNFHDNFLASRFDKRKDEFLANVPERLKEEFTQRTDIDRSAWSIDAGKYELNQEQDYYRNEITKSADGALVDIAQMPEGYDPATSLTAELIRSSRLPEAERTKMMDAWRKDSVRTQQIAFVQKSPELAADFTGAIKESGTASLIKEKEGFRNRAYDDGKTDKNGKRVGPAVYRAGYGSDTYTTADGKVHKVTKDTVVTRADAERDLERRIGEFQKQVVKDIGNEAFTNLDDPTQSVITSIAYNYGNVPRRLRASLQSGNKAHIANAILTLRGDNGGINRKRRESEAAIVRGSKAMRPGSYTLPDTPPPPPDSLPDGLGLEDYNAIASAARGVIEQTERDQVAIDRQEQAARAAEYSASLDQLKFAITDGKAGVEEIQAFRDENQIPYKDFDSLMTEYKQAEKAREDETLSLEAFNDPDRVFDYSNADEKKLIDNVYDSIIKDGDLSDENVAQTALSLAKRVNAVPKAFEGQIKALIDGTDTANAREGFDLLDRLYAINPQMAIRDMSQGTIRRLHDYKALQGLIDDEDLMKATRSSGDIVSDSVRKDREKQADKDLEDFTVEHLVDQMDPSFMPFTEAGIPADEIVQSRFLQDYKSLYKNQFARTNNPEAAAASARDLLESRWGASTANDGRMMRFPPERFHVTVGGSHDWMNKQITKGLKELNPDSVLLPKVQIVATRETEKDIAAKRNPRYMIIQKNENGAYEPMLDDQGRQASIRFDATPYLKKERQKFQGMREAREAIANAPVFR